MLQTERLSSVYLSLRLTYGLVPIVAGLDKFSNLLTDWAKYLPKEVVAMLPMDASTFMMIVGIIEIVAGLAVLTILTRLGAYVVMVWLLLIAGNLVLAGYLDIAVRDIVMSIGAYSLGQIAAIRGDKWSSNAVFSESSTGYAASS